MMIEHADKHTWQRMNAADALSYFTGSNRKKVQTSLPLLEAAGVTYTVAPATRAMIDQFTPLYLTTINGKENPNPHNVYEKTIGNPTAAFPYYGLELYDHGVYVGGTIFSVRPDRVSYAYRSYLRTWPQATLKANPALIAEYAVAEYALAHQLPLISHGKDRNPYGRNSNIGLAIFKLSLGYTAYLPATYERHTLDTDTVTDDILVLERPAVGDRITDAFLIVDQQNEAVYAQLLAYPEQLRVHVLHRD